MGDAFGEGDEEIMDFSPLEVGDNPENLIFLGDFLKVGEIRSWVSGVNEMTGLANI